MNSGRIERELAVLAVFCVLAIFLFPAMQGPYSAVNGPVTALQSARGALRLRAAIVQSACQSLGTLPISLVILSLISLLGEDRHPFTPAASTAVLRC